MSKEQEQIQWASRLVNQLVRKVEALQEEAAGRSIRGKDVSADWLCDQLDDLLQATTPDGKSGRLSSDGDDNFHIVLGTRITGESVISTHPGDFNGAVWDEAMDRAPKDGVEE
jgi:hypothetical protein